MFTASAQKYRGSFALFNIVLVASTKVLFFLSTTPFCCGVLGAEYCREIPFSVQNLFRIAFLNYVPLSNLIFLTGRFACNSILFMWSMIILGVSSFKLINNTQVYLKKSSTITRAYRFLDKDITFTGPNNFICKSCSGSVILVISLLLCDAFFDFPLFTYLTKTFLA